MGSEANGVREENGVRIELTMGRNRVINGLTFLNSTDAASRTVQLDWTCGSPFDWADDAFGFTSYLCIHPEFASLGT